MEREEIEQVERELDEILRIVQPEREDDQALTEEEEDLKIQEDEEGEENPLLQEEQGDRLRILKPSDGMVAAFFVPIAVMIIIFAQRGIFPFGEECFLRTDMYH